MNGHMTPSLLRITEVYQDGADSRHFSFEPVVAARHPARPGQFFTLAIPGHGEAAFTYLSLPDADGRFKALIRRVGRLTSALFRRSDGDLIGFRGPFGNGWPLDRLRGRRVLVIAGGIGLPPLAAAVERLCAAGDTPVGLIYGCRTPAEQVLERERSAWRSGMPVLETFDRPSDREQLAGTPLEHLHRMEVALGGPPEAVLTCGPERMMQAVGHHFAAAGLPAESIWLALERRMHCGVGECGHCYLGSSMVCTEGPVYSWRELVRLQSLTTAAP